mmetsp:Transcript_5449/g.6801  ORF Transcript_5449/g.6801 Transcript_5449/m.6801 type:complete len:207 (+) Transcript_5449:1305-1925(+)
MRRHGTFCRKTTEYAHCINKIPQKRHRHNLIHRLVQRIERQRQIQKHVRMRQNERKTPGSSREEPRILPQIQKRHGGSTTTQRPQTLTQRVPLGNSLGTVLPALLHQQLVEILFTPNGKPPVSRRSPVPQSRIRLHRHLLLQNIKNHPQGVQTRPIQSFKNTRPHFETVLPPVMHPRKRVRAPATLDMTLQHQHLIAVFRRERAAR